MPIIIPTIILTFSVLKNEPCPQSWNMIKIRIRKPHARNVSRRVIQYEYVRLLNNKNHIKTYGISELQICQMLFPSSG
jgi:hypothetical protein